MEYNNIEDKIRNTINHIDTVPKGIEWNPGNTWNKLQQGINKRKTRKIKWYAVAASVLVVISVLLNIDFSGETGSIEGQSSVMLKKIERSLEQPDDDKKTFFMDVDQQDQINLLEKQKMHFSIYMVCREC